MYAPIKAPATQSQQVMTTMAQKGVNIHDAPEFLKIDQALNIENYLITAIGALKKRKGIIEKFNIASDYPVTLIEEFTSDIWILAYGTKIDAYELSTGTVTNIKTYTDPSTYEGQRYGDYFFVTNKLEQLGRISRTLAYDGQTANFTVGKVLTGQTSGATAIILQDADSGATGVLTLGSIVGTFQNNETITDNNGSPGSATANGVVTWAYTTVSAAPVCLTLAILATRLFYVPANDPSSVGYTEVDDGTNPPFTNFTTGTDANDPGQVFGRKAGTALSVSMIGNVIVVLAENGKWAFTIDTIESGGSLIKSDTIVIDRIDFGGSRAVANTARGVLYANENGLWQLQSLGQPNIPYSDQEYNLTIDSLGDEYFNDIDLTNADVIYDGSSDSAYLTCAKNSEVNNLVIVYNFQKKAVTKITGWNINRWMTIGDAIYGASSGSAKVYTCFSGYNDDGVDIYTEFLQEIATASPSMMSIFQGFYTKGFLSPSSEPQIAFDIYNIEGEFEANKRQFTWTAQSSSEAANDGFGKVPFGQAGWGGNNENQVREGMIESFDGARWPISNYQRLRVKVTCSDQLPHEITWMQFFYRQKAQIRRRKLQLVTS